MTCGRTDPQARWLVGEPTCKRLVGEINLKATWPLGLLTRKRDDLLQKMTCWRNNKWARVPNKTGTYFGFCAMGGGCTLILCTCSAGKCNSCFSLLLLGSRITFVTLNWYGFAKLEIFFCNVEFDSTELSTFIKIRVVKELVDWRNSRLLK